MTKEQLKQNAAALNAFSDGRPIELWLVAPQGWTASHNREADALLFDMANGFLYRPAPEPKTRPWGVNDVPTVCWIRSRHEPNCTFGVMQIGPDGVWTSNGSGNMFWGWTRLSDSDVEYSTDLKTWSRCEVTE